MIETRAWLKPGSSWRRREFAVPVPKPSYGLCEWSQEHGRELRYRGVGAYEGDGVPVVELEGWDLCHG